MNISALKIHISAATKEFLETFGDYNMTERGSIVVKVCGLNLSFLQVQTVKFVTPEGKGVLFHFSAFGYSHVSMISVGR